MYSVVRPGFMLASRVSLLPLLLALAVAAGCDDDFGANLDEQTNAIDGDPVKACPVPQLGDIPGHESIFYGCAETSADLGRGCGPDGYLIGYGSKYAQRFYQQARPRMTLRGQKWIDDVLVCLQHDLRDQIDSTTSCDDIWTIAFDSHPSCYTRSGFCTLSPLDVAQVIWTIDAKDWLSRDASRQVLTTALGCGREYSGWLRFVFAYLLHD
jgi:hypothetical protein